MCFCVHCWGFSGPAHWSSTEISKIVVLLRFSAINVSLIPTSFPEESPWPPFLFFSKKRSHKWSEVSRRYGFGKETQETWNVLKVWHLKVFGIQIWHKRTTDEPVAQLSEPLPAEPEVVVQSHLLLLFFLHACAVWKPSMRIIPFWRHYSSLFRNIFRPTCVMILKLITWDAILDFSTALRARPWLPPWGTESWPAGAPWVLGFSPEGGSRLCSEGELVMSSRKNGKRTPGTPDGTCGQPERGRLAWPLVVFWHPVLGRAPFPRAHCARRASGSPGRDSSAGGSARLTSGTPNCGRGIPPQGGVAD